MFREKIERGDFVITCEVLPPLDLDLEHHTNLLRPLTRYIDTFNIPFCPLGKLRPHSMLTANFIKKKIGCDPIVHFAACHQTTLSFEASLLFCQGIGITNILCVTGDPPTEGKGSYSLNSVELLRLAKLLNQGLSSSRRKIPLATNFLLCAAYNPNRINILSENLRAKKKCLNGAVVFFTQPVFNPARFIEIVRDFKDSVVGIRVIAGLSFLYEKKIAIKLQKFLGIPYKYIEDMGKRDEEDLLFEIGVEINNLVDGFYIIPIGRYDRALQLAKRFFDAGVTKPNSDYSNR